MSHETAASNEALAPRSPLYQGPYGRIFADLPPWRPEGVADDELEAFCLDIATRLMLEQPPGADGVIPTPQDVSAQQQAAGLQADPQFSGSIPAAYTYFGQFVDHDITFDPTSSLQRSSDPNKLVNFRTPRLDLDNVYGRGPDDQPYLYDQTGPHGTLLVGSIEGSSLHDVPRNLQGRALIGDPRNDENAIVSQLHLAFLLAHNALLARAVTLGVPDPFAAARTTLRWLYQWIVWNDFLKQITDPKIHADALTPPNPDGRAVWVRSQKDLYNWRDQPYMPVEFSGAAYRFGHSMVRNSYQTNSPHRGFGQFVPIFDNTEASSGGDLHGFRAGQARNAIQWDWFLPMGSTAPFPQMAHRIDTKLANALAFLHEGAAGKPGNVLASRNILRGIRLELPSGVDVATQLGVTPIALTADEPEALWYYILKEAEVGDGAHLGAVGSTILTAVFAGLLQGDPQSWVNIAPRWTPDADPLLAPDAIGPLNRDDAAGEWKLSAIIRLSGLPVSESDFPAV